ncbi:MAG: heme exporter protein CcmB [Desulfovibrio sp.]|nr:heme exporter protein CcmB [Desulfovibrio sp.]
MIAASLAILGKDMRLLVFRSGVIVQSFLLGLTLVFVFSLSMAPGQKSSPQENAAVFWMSSIFFSIMIFNQLYRLEEDNGSRAGLLLANIRTQAIWLGKCLTGFLLLLGAQAIFLPAVVAFLGQSEIAMPGEGFLMLLLADAGISTLGALLGAVSHSAASRDSLLSVILFPLLIPLLLAAVSVGSAVFGADNAALSSWFGLAAAFDAIFIAAALILFGFIYGGDE